MRVKSDDTVLWRAFWVAVVLGVAVAAWRGFDFAARGLLFSAAVQATRGLAEFVAVATLVGIVLGAAMRSVRARSGTPALAVGLLAAIAAFVALRVGAAWLYGELPWAVDAVLGAAVFAWLLSWPRAPGARRVERVVGVVALVVLGAGLALPTLLKPAGARPNVLLVVVDCLRRDHVGAYGYERDTSPVLDSIAADGMMFTNAYSTASWTKPAVASIITGRYPFNHGTIDMWDRLSSRTPVLAERLVDRGYRTSFFNGGNTFISDRFGFEAGFWDYAFVFPQDARKLNQAFAGVLARMEPERPWFAYVHYMDLHLPYNKNPYNELFAPNWPAARPLVQPNRIRTGPIREASAEGALTDAEKQMVVDLYDGQIRFVDAGIDDLLGMLDAAKRLANTYVIVTADHGEEFWEHGNYEHGHSLYQEVVAVPLVVFGPDVPARRVDAPVSLVDVYSTVLALAGATVDSGAEGVGLLAHLDTARRADTQRAIPMLGTLYGGEKVGLVDAGVKGIRNLPRTEAKARLVGPAATAPVEIYDLRSDPGERHNLAALPSVDADAWRARLEVFARARDAAAGAAARPAVDDELREQLRSLGYVQ